MTAALTLWIIVSVAAIAFGALMLFAGGMSDNPGAGNSAASTGCGFAFGGIVSLVVAIAVLVLR